MTTAAERLELTPGMSLDQISKHPDNRPYLIHHPDSTSGPLEHVFRSKSGITEENLGYTDRTLDQIGAPRDAFQVSPRTVLDSFGLPDQWTQINYHGHLEPGLRTWKSRQRIDRASIWEQPRLASISPSDDRRQVVNTFYFFHSLDEAHESSGLKHIIFSDKIVGSGSHIQDFYKDRVLRQEAHDIAEARGAEVHYVDPKSRKDCSDAAPDAPMASLQSDYSSHAAPNFSPLSGRRPRDIHPVSYRRYLRATRATIPGSGVDSAGVSKLSKAYSAENFAPGSDITLYVPYGPSYNSMMYQLQQRVEEDGLVENLGASDISFRLGGYFAGTDVPAPGA